MIGGVVGGKWFIFAAARQAERAVD